MATISVRYIVDDINDVISFYCDRLTFTLKMHPAPIFTMLENGDLRLLISLPDKQGGGGQILEDGRKPRPDDFNRISLQVSDLDPLVKILKEKGVCFRTDIIFAVGGNQVLVEDPS